jgi:hypothetical protein
MWEQFRQGRERVENWLTDDLTFTIIIVVLVAVASFGLGRWSLESVGAPDRPILVPTPVAVEQVAAVSGPAPTAPATAQRDTTQTGNFVASVNGTKFHALDCPGAKQISEQNKIYFQTEEEARSAGYTPAANCSF